MIGNQFHSFRIDIQSEEMFCRPARLLVDQKRKIKGPATTIAIAALATLVVACGGAGDIRG